MTTDVAPVAVLGLATADGRTLTAVARPDTPRDGVHPLAELAVLAAAGDWEEGMMAIPVRLRDITVDEVVDRHTLLTSFERRPDGGVDIAALGVMAGADADKAWRWGLDPAESPVAALLFDAVVRAEHPPPLHQVVAVLQGWGHQIDLDDPLPDVDHAALGRDRHRVHRLARELGRRNRPVARTDTANRPAVPANLPPGFVPACPL